MTHGNAPLSVEGRRRLVARCQSRPIAHVAAEMGISRACASRWVNRYRRFGELGLQDRSSAPSRQPTATPVQVITVIEAMRRDHKWSAARIAFELGGKTGIDRNGGRSYAAPMWRLGRRSPDRAGGVTAFDEDSRARAAALLPVPSTVLLRGGPSFTRIHPVRAYPGEKSTPFDGS